MKQIIFFNYSLDLSLSKKYYEVIVKFFGPEILNDKVDVLFDLLILKNKTSIYQEKPINFNIDKCNKTQKRKNINYFI